MRVTYALCPSPPLQHYHLFLYEEQLHRYKGYMCIYKHLRAHKHTYAYMCKI